MRTAARSVVFLLLLCSGGLLSSASAQRASPANGPKRVIREFYGWYVQALVGNQDPFRKGRAQLKRYATDRLIREIDKMRTGPDGLDGDYFLDAQDFDREWAKNITISHLMILGTDATADVQLKGREVGTHNLHVTLVQQQGVWKVDKVAGK